MSPLTPSLIPGRLFLRDEGRKLHTGLPREQAYHENLWLPATRILRSLHWAHRRQWFQAALCRVCVHPRIGWAW